VCSPAAADVGLHVDATACLCFPVKDSFSDVIMNEHLKLSSTGIRYGEDRVSSGEGSIIAGCTKLA